jgi:hypothetical protein
MFGRYRAGDTFGEKEQTLYRRIPVFDTLTAARQTDDTATALLYEKNNNNKNRSFPST